MFGGRMKTSTLQSQAKGRPAGPSQRCVSLVLALALVFLLLPCAVDAQVLYGSLTGNVTDPTGAAIPGAKVEALNTGTGVRSETATDDHGLYRFTNIQAGLYTVTVSSKSFATFVETGVQVSNTEVRRVDVQLQISQTTSTLEVRADAVCCRPTKPISRPKSHRRKSPNCRLPAAKARTTSDWSSWFPARASSPARRPIPRPATRCARLRYS